MCTVIEWIIKKLYWYEMHLGNKIDITGPLVSDYFEDSMTTRRVICKS